MIVAVIGKIKTRRWLDKNKRSNYITEIIADEIKILNSYEKDYENFKNDNNNKDYYNENEEEIYQNNEINEKENESYNSLDEEEVGNEEEYNEYYDENLEEENNN